MQQLKLELEMEELGLWCSLHPEHPIYVLTMRHTLGTLKLQNCHAECKAQQAHVSADTKEEKLNR
jgi:hypothetical protein